MTKGSRLWIGIGCLALASCGMAPETMLDGAVEDGALLPVDAAGVAILPRARAHRPRAVARAGLARARVEVPLPETRALQTFATLLRRDPRSLAAFAPDGSYLLLDRRGALHRIDPEGQRTIRRLGAVAGRADGIAATDGALIWYRAVRPRSRAGMAFYFDDLELHLSRDGGASFQKQVARLTIGNVGYLLQIDRGGRLRLWTGAEFRCGGGAYTRFDGRIGEAPEEWSRDDSLVGAESFPSGTRLPRRY
jgi:hypothetical protein